MDAGVVTTPINNGTNMAEVERWGSLLIGGGLLLQGARRRSLGGAAVAALGAVFLERGLTGRCHLYHAFGLDTSGPRDVVVSETAQVNLPPDVCYQAWRDLEGLPRFLSHLESVVVGDNGHSRWAARFAGQLVTWEAKLVQDQPGRFLSWQSLAGSAVETTGYVRFEELPAGRGTGVRIEIAYRAPAGALGQAFARLLNPAVRLQLHEDLRRFKRMLEAREVATTEGQTSGRLELQEVEP
jgi:uncharacterized membrane protein